MVLPNWDALPVRTKRSRKRLYTVLATEYSLTAWKSLPYNVKRSKKHLYNYIASQKNLEEYDELAKNNMRSTRLLYTYIKENASGSKPTLKIKVKDGDTNLSGASVTIGSTTETTNASGEASFTLDYDNYTFTVEKTYYEDYTENIKFRANHKTFTVPLEATLYKVTVTAKDGSANALSNATVNIKQSTTILATGKTGTDGKVELNVRAGTFTLEAESSDKSLSYTGSLTVDGDETATITLTSGSNTGTVTVTCKDSETNPLEGVRVLLLTEPITGDADWATVKGLAVSGDDGTGTFKELDDEHQLTEVDAEVEYGTYYIATSYDTGQGMFGYQGTVTVDEAQEEVTITLTPMD